MMKNIYLFIFISISLYGSLNGLSLINNNLRSIAKRQVNPCQFVTCLNGGVCVSNQNLAKCSCPIGFFGVKCQFTTTTLAAKPCGSLTCLNGGVCFISGANSTACFCPAGFSGNSCELTAATTASPIRVEECQPNTCLNNQPCKVLDGKPQCFCLGNFIEPNCASPLPPGVLSCTTNPCQNNGQCLNINGVNQCLCIGPFTGATCETNLRKRNN